VWQIAQGPEWAADTGIPLLVTLAGLVVAHVFLTRQLNSDSLLRRGDHRPEAPSALGKALAQAALELERRPAEDKWWRQPCWDREWDLVS
jgi:hypothetical protein